MDTIEKTPRGRPPLRHTMWCDATPREKLQRMERVLDVLTAMTPHQVENHFYMGIWGQKTSCGTVGCAAGHCAMDPWFKRRGFTARFDDVNHMNFDNLSPAAFFGPELYNDVFVNSLLSLGTAKHQWRAVKSAMRSKIRTFKANYRAELRA